MEKKYRCFNCKRTFLASEVESKKMTENFHVAGIPDGSELPACPHCKAVAFFGFRETKE